MSKKIDPVTIIIPTYNNTTLLQNCLHSMAATRDAYPLKIIVVNNGHPESTAQVQETEWLKVIQSNGQNLGWEGGLIEGLKHTNTEFVMFANDDIVIPPSEVKWLRKMLELFRAPNVGAVGPSSNVVTGAQNMLNRTPHMRLETTFLIGFCVLLRRSALDAAGGIDNTLPGGDDFDLSIRLKDKGYTLAIDRTTFVFHYGFATGQRLYGDPSKKGGWNSPQRIERTNTGLISKHGFKKWFETASGTAHLPRQKGIDVEGAEVKKHIVGEKIVDLGCANNKTVPIAVGVDICKKGDKIPLLNAISEADVQGDAEKQLPFDDASQDTVIARHLLEHCIDPIKTLKEWIRILKPGGRLIIAVPNETVMETIPLNAEHVHAFTPESLKNLGEVMGLTVEHIEVVGYSISVVIVFKK